jgi:multidrug resistance protein, MATE family
MAVQKNIDAGTRGHWVLEIKSIVALAWPMVVTNFAQTAMTATDVLMLSRLGPDTLAASGLGTNLHFLFMIFGLGLVLGVAPVLAQEIGAYRHELRRVRQTVRHGLWLSMLISLPIWLILWNGRTILIAIGQDEGLAAKAGEYMRALQWSILPFFSYIVLRSFISALERPLWAMGIMVFAVGLNALANYALIFGHFGMPALGILGSGLATTVASTMMFLALAAVVTIDRQFSRYHLFGHFWRLDSHQFVHLLKLGFNIGLLLTFEVGLFAASGLIMGIIGRDTIAAYMVTIQLSSLAFMVPLGISQAATVRVGLAYGAKSPDGMKRAGWVSFFLATGFMILVALVMVLIPEQLIGLFLNKEAAESAVVFVLAVAFLKYVALFQIVDGAQAVAGGMLRGLQDTKIPVIIGAIGYWAVGMPVGLLLAFYYGLEGAGMWFGLASGLAFVAIALLWRWVIVTWRMDVGTNFLK